MPSEAETKHPTSNVDIRPRITVVGVGGAGGNAVNNMIRSKLEGVEFVVANTDAQSLHQSLVESTHRLQLGMQVTQGLGAGAKPDVGRAAAEESLEDVIRFIQGSNMVFITAGMGGGTGTGAAPVIARAARESGILTVGVVTKPFQFEGTHRMRSADKGIEELQQFVDTLIIIPNQNLFRVATERTTFADAFKLADDVLYSGVRGVTDLMIMPGLINLDFADIRSVMGEMGKALMGTGEAEGERRAIDAAEAAISNPLLDDVSMKGAKGVLINITGGHDMTLYEVDEAANRIREEVDPNANIIFGSTFDESLNGRMRVSVVATGIGPSVYHQAPSSSPFGSSNFGMAGGSSSWAASNTQSAVEQGKSFQGEDIAIAATSTVVEIPVTVNDLHGMKEDPGLDGDIPSQVQESLKNLDGFTKESYQESTAAPLAPPTPEKKRPTSLFERFTGSVRQKAAPVSDKSSEMAQAGDSDVLQIPAFLRRTSGN